MAKTGKIDRRHRVAMRLNAKKNMTPLKHVSLSTRIRMLKGGLRSLGKQKYFGIGRNKSGTTSLTIAMEELGFVVGEQRPAELLLRDWACRDFRRLRRYCRSAQFFQDVPFSLPHTYQAMDMYFPGSKFILTVRDPDEWHASMVRFHRQPKVHGDRARSLEALREAEYCYKGYAYETKVLVYALPGDDPYEKDTLISHYHFHNRSVQDYFRNRPQDLLVLDVSEPDAYQRLCDFVGREGTRECFPKANVSGQGETSEQSQA